MFKIFYDSLFKPRNIVNHVDEKPKIKFVGFMIFTLILLVLPTVILSIFNYNISNDDVKYIKDQLNKKTICHKIEDNNLIYTGYEMYESCDVIKLDGEEINYGYSLGPFMTPIYVVFSNSDVLYSNFITEEIAYIVKIENSDVLICSYYNKSTQNGVTKLANDQYVTIVRSFKLDVNDIDFNKEEASGQAFSTSLYGFCNFIYKKATPNFFALLITSRVFITILNLFLSIMFTVAIMGLFFRFMGIPFKAVVKIVFLCYTPYVVGSMLSVCFDTSIISYIAEIISLVYTYKVMRNYSLLMILKRGVNEK